MYSGSDCRHCGDEPARRLVRLGTGHDLYERRYRASDAARKLLSEVANRAVSCKPLKGFNEARALLSAMLFGGNTPFNRRGKSIRLLEARRLLRFLPWRISRNFRSPSSLRRQNEDAGGLKLVYIDPPFDFGADFR